MHRSRAVSEPIGAVRAFTDHRELLATLRARRPGDFQSSSDALSPGHGCTSRRDATCSSRNHSQRTSKRRPISSAWPAARDLKVGVGHQFRLCPSLIEARERIAAGAIGPLRLVTCILARPWLTHLGEEEKTWRRNANGPPGGILADAGDHLIDALLWTTGQVAVEVGAIQSQTDPGVDLVTAAAIRLADGTPVSLAVSGISPGSLFALDYFGDWVGFASPTKPWRKNDSIHRGATLPCRSATETIDGNFVAALANDSPLCCPADQALDTVRLLEAIGGPPRPDKSFD